MPEPQVKPDGELDPDNLNRDSPFEILSEFHATLRQKLFFISFPVLVGYVFVPKFYGIEETHEGNVEVKGRNIYPFVSRFLHQFTKCQWAHYYLLGNFRGAGVNAISMRSSCAFTVIILCAAPRQWSVFLENYAQKAQFHMNDDVMCAVETYLNVPGFFFCSCCMYAFSIIRKNEFSERSAYGVYCCAAWERGRIVRIMIILEVFFSAFDYVVNQFLANPKLIDLGQALPLLIFGWKRAKYVLSLVVCLEDNPYKHRAIFSMVLCCMMFMNHILMVSMIGADGWDTLFTFVIVDWFQFGMRISFLLRIGMSICPKLMIFLVKKQLENIASPLPQHAVAVGNKTAMRCMQAFMCLVEGETLTMNFVFVLVFFVQSYELMKHNKLLQCVPMRSVGILLIFAALDTMQDIIAGNVSNRFCNFSYAFAREPTSWHSKRLIPMWMIVYTAWMAYVTSWGGALVSKMCAADAGSLTKPSPTNFSMPAFCIFHL